MGNEMKNLRQLAIWIWHEKRIGQGALSKFCRLKTEDELDRFWLLHELGRDGQKMKDAAERGEQIERDYQGRGIRLLTLLDASYPGMLALSRMAPPVLGVSGQIECLDMPQVAIVGSRTLHREAEKIEIQVSNHLMERGFILTSGGALGVDAIAHRQAMHRNHPTVVVLGTGLDEIYPKENRDIFSYAVQRGVVISQYPLKTAPAKTNFPTRNAVIAGLSVGTIIIQCREKSGALYTANFSNQLKRPVLVAAITGFDELSEGGLNLIKSGKARLLSCASDLDILGTGSSRTAMEGRQLCLEDWGNEMQRLMVSLLRHQPLTRELLRSAVEERGMTGDFDESLLDLELEGRVERVGGNFVIGR